MLTEREPRFTQSSADEQIAAALAIRGGQGAGNARAEADRRLEALIDAFRDGRWGSFYSLFPEPITALRELSELLADAVPIMIGLPTAPQVVWRVLQVVTELAAVVAMGERRLRATEAHEQRELLEVQSDFLGLTIHEVRGPLSRANGLISMIRDGDFGEVPEGMRDPVAVLGAAIQELNALMDSLAVVARLDNGGEVLRLAPCKVGPVVAAALEAVRPEAAAKGIRLREDAHASGLELVVDAGRLRIAVVNLVSNAVKYAPAESAVTVRVGRRTGAVTIGVTDEGPGIDQSEAHRVFEKHQRGAAARQGVPGLGLGLYIVRRIVELHGGIVTLDSAPGSGSTFTILLPFS